MYLSFKFNVILSKIFRLCLTGCLELSGQEQLHAQRMFSVIFPGAAVAGGAAGEVGLPGPATVVPGGRPVGVWLLELVATVVVVE